MKASPTPAYNQCKAGMFLSRFVQVLFFALFFLPTSVLNITRRLYERHAGDATVIDL
jgi:hypothetical protein